ncbi:hypothetical protein J4573_31440 [Actinomadura barringtoniae]|uniref:Uncharacterized protein n=1 Tax=Actinomadura barringtoniae TaxID=1427535 RepID=A0A939T3T6_9ACTN|nr:hypothetical protein [Actinomadura barringtoniae]MBO2451641.1 hypothetical protein [Actinomadura barringtoniae]
MTPRTPATDAGQWRTEGVSVVGGLVGVRMALIELDAIDPDTDSIAFDQATDHLIDAARTAVAAAQVLFASPCTMAATVRDALAREAIQQAQPRNYDTSVCDGEGRCDTCRRSGPVTNTP